MVAPRNGSGDGSRRRPRLIDRTAFFDRDPAFPPPSMFGNSDIRVLDPAAGPVVAGVAPRPTLYVGSRLIVSGMRDVGRVLSLLRPVAGDLGWTIAKDRRFKAVRVASSAEGRGDFPDWAESDEPGITRLRLSVPAVEQSDEDVEKPPPAPDAWKVLQHARATHGIESLAGVGLDHVLFATDVGVNPWQGAPWQGAPWQGAPWQGAPWQGAGGGAAATYGVPGMGGRQPLSYVGPPPERSETFATRRALVGTLDTGCGYHPWLERAVKRDADLGQPAIGYTSARSDPEIFGDQAGPIDGAIDVLAGHGTFIAGLIHQGCAEADIIPWRIVELTRPIVESELVAALTKIVERVEHYYDSSGKEGHALDVLNLSMGYYHETPEELQYDPTIWDLLRRLTSCGTVVVCSAGNDATARTMFPAAFGPWSKGKGLYPSTKNRAPIISVGALNPNGDTVALFSNTGDWVRVYAEGAAVVSTIPRYEGGLLPVARTKAFGHTRESIDPDDYRGGFAAWSGTSFAAPVVAGRVAQKVSGQLEKVGDPVSRKKAVERAWEAVTSLYDLAPGG